MSIKAGEINVPRLLIHRGVEQRDGCRGTIDQNSGIGTWPKNDQRAVHNPGDEQGIAAEKEDLVLMVIDRRAVVGKIRERTDKTTTLVELKNSFAGYLLVGKGDDVGKDRVAKDIQVDDTVMGVVGIVDSDGMGKTAIIVHQEQEHTRVVGHGGSLAGGECDGTRGRLGGVGVGERAWMELADATHNDNDGDGQEDEKQSLFLDGKGKHENLHLYAKIQKKEFLYLRISLMFFAFGFHGHKLIDPFEHENSKNTNSQNKWLHIFQFIVFTHHKTQVAIRRNNRIFAA